MTSLKLTQSNQKQQPNKNKPQQHVHQEQVKQPKQMSLHKFTLKPDNNEYFLGIIRIPQQNVFRVAIIDKTDCWITREHTFERIKNKSNISGQSIEQFSDHLVRALRRPNDNRYEIEEIYFDTGTQQDTLKKQIIIYHLVHGLRVQMANFKFYGSKNGKNCNCYIFEKLSLTLREKTMKNEQYKRDNINFQKRYNETLELLNESISAKNQQEEELLNKFVVILNEKKKQIRALQSEIIQLKGNGNGNNNNIQMELDEEVKEIEFNLDITKNEQDNNKNKNRNRKRKIVVLDDSENEEIVVPKCKKRKITKQKQSRKSDIDVSDSSEEFDIDSLI